MAITKIKSPELFDFSDLNTALQLPTGTTLERPAAPSSGEWRYNTTLKYVEFYDGAAWRQIDTESLPTVPSENFNAVIYAGRGAVQSITGVGFQPDLIWVMNRSQNAGAGYLNAVVDSVRGATPIVSTNSSNGEETIYTQEITSFDSDGFSLGTGTGNYTNIDYDSYVAWCWKAGGAPTTDNIAGVGNVPTSGSVKQDGADSTAALTGTIVAKKISANTKAGFSIVEYDGTGTAGTIDHLLGAVPNLILVKRTDTSGNWIVGSTEIDSNSWTKILQLDLTDGEASYTGFNDTPPTSSVFSLGSNNPVNNSSGNYIAYCFANISDYQKIGSYTGTGLVDGEGPIVNTGFEPALLLIKQSSTSGNNWVLYDNKRDPVNARYRYLSPNTSDAEGSNDATNYPIVDFLTNGFQIAGTDGRVNTGGATYIYLAIASDPTSTTPTLTNSFKTNLHVGNGSYQTIGGNLGGAGVMLGNGSIVLPNSTNFNGTSDLSISVWVFRQNTNRTFIVDKANGGPTQYGWQLEWQSASAGFVFQMNNTSNTLVDVRTGAIANNEQTWEHVVATFNPSTFGAEIYYNGILCDTATHSGTVSTNSNGVTIGTYSLSSGFELTGSIDQFRFFDTVLTASQVSELYNETSSTANTLNFPTGAGCFAAYPFDSNADDLSGSYDASSVTNVTYTSGLGLSPNFTWTKAREAASSHQFFDTIRGPSNVISSESTSAQTDLSPYGVTSFDKNGANLFDISSGNYGVNGASGGTYSGTPPNYVDWTWKASKLPSISTETADLASIINPNVNAGFSIARWIGEEQAGQTVAHGLGGTPEIAFIKQLDGGRDWTVPLFTRTSGDYMYLNSTQTVQTDTSNWSAVTSTLMTVGASPYTNGAGSPTIGYFFRSISGYQKIGYYDGNNGNAQTIYTTDDGTSGGANGFQVKFLLIKNLNAANSWNIFDSERGANNALFPNLNAVEYDYTTDASGSPVLTFASNGFNLLTSSNSNVGEVNGSNLNTYLYIAIGQ